MGKALVKRQKRIHVRYSKHISTRTTGTSPHLSLWHCQPQRNLQQARGFFCANAAACLAVLKLSDSQGAAASSTMCSDQAAALKSSGKRSCAQDWCVFCTRSQLLVHVQAVRAVECLGARVHVVDAPPQLRQIHVAQRLRPCRHTTQVVKDLRESKSE